METPYPLEDYTLSAQNVADLLDYSYKHVCLKTRSGEIPAKKRGKKWIYCKAEINASLNVQTKNAVAKPEENLEDLKDDSGFEDPDSSILQ